MTELTTLDRQLLDALCRGLPLERRPYAELGRTLGLSEEAVLARIQGWLRDGTLKRFGVVVRHHELGWAANAMVVWQVDPDRMDRLAALLTGFPFVTLCYSRRPIPERWPFNLYCMIHGVDRVRVLEQVDRLVEAAGSLAKTYRVLFSRRRFKQCGPVMRHVEKPKPTRACPNELVEDRNHCESWVGGET